MSTTKEKIAIMQAFEDGKVIQFRLKGLAYWDIVEKPAWNWDAFAFRIKPEPKKVTMQIYQDKCTGRLRAFMVIELPDSNIWSPVGQSFEFTYPEEVK